MKYIHNTTQIMSDKQCVVVLGNFDGIHVGHQELLKQAKKEAISKNIEVMVVSFYPPPTWVLNKKKKELIASREEKVKLMEFYGVDTFVEYPFDVEFSKTTPQDFIKNILIDKFNAKSIVIGSNYHFGNGRIGDAKYLKDIGRSNSIDVNVVDTVQINGITVSSTVIRGLIDKGDIQLVNKMLGRSYSVLGKVEYGKQLGRTIGFPTANLSTDDNRIYPPNGVYATTIEIKNKTYIGVTNIGINPTVSGKNKTIETNIFDFNKEIYGESICVNFYEYIRSEKKFNGLQELKQQITADSDYVKRIFKK